MKILVSNDDGYFAPGIAALAEALAPLGEITVVAPERDRSGASNSLTLDRPLMRAPRAQRLPLRQRHADRLRPHRGDRAARLRARHDRLGHQPRRQHGRRHASTPAPSPRRPKATCSASRRSPCRSPSKAGEHFETAARVARDWSARSRARRSASRCCSTSTCPTCRRASCSGIEVTRLGKRHKARAGGQAQEPARRDRLLGRRGRRRRRRRAGHRLPRASSAAASR